MTRDKLGSESLRNSEILQSHLIGELAPFCVSLLIAPNRDLRPGEIEGATGCLLNTGERQLLITCYHVWEHYSNRNGQGKPGCLVIILQQGYGAVEISKPQLVDANEELDLAVLDFSDADEILGEKQFYPLRDRPFALPEKGNILAILGYPRIWRKEEINIGVFGFLPLPFVVSDVTTRAFVVSEQDDNKEVFDGLDAEPRPAGLHDSCGGLSGAPAFAVEQKPFRLAGFVTKRVCGGLFFTRADLICRNGVIRPQSDFAQ